MDKLNSIEEELNAENKKGRYEYNKMLRQLCPSREMRKQARRISNRKYPPCNQCAYHDEKGKCKSPTFMYNIFIDIDHCYEGVLRFLLSKSEKAREFEFEINDKLVTEMADALEIAVDNVNINSEISRTFARWIIMMTDGNWKMPLEAKQCVRETLDLLNEFLEQPCDEEAGADDEWV